VADVIQVVADTGGTDALQVEVEGRSGPVVPLQSGRVDAVLQAGSAEVSVVAGGPPGPRGPQGPQGNPSDWAQDIYHPVLNQGPFPLSFEPVPFSEHASLNGYSLVNGMDYTLTDATVFILPALGCTLSNTDVIVFTYQKAGV
jgi:hypothetical protein